MGIDALKAAVTTQLLLLRKQLTEYVKLGVLLLFPPLLAA